VISTLHRSAIVGAIIALVLVAAGCGSNSVRVTSVAHDRDGKPAEQPLTPAEVNEAMEALCQRVVQQICTACERIDATNRANAVRRESLLWRIRATETAAAAQDRDNHVLGMIELWFWTASMAAYYGEDGGGSQAFGSSQDDAIGCTARLADECEHLVQRTVPPKGFAALRERVMTAAGKGELFTASAAESRDMLRSLLDVTHIESLISLPLAPFTALKGIGTGSDAVANLVVEAQRAVDLAERYPQLLTWNAQLAVLGIEEQETVRGLRTDMKRLVDAVEVAPRRMREEAAMLLSDAAMTDTLTQAAGTAEAMTKLAVAVDALLARIQTMNQSEPGEAQDETPGRAFDIREYESALRVAESTARQAQSAITAATESIGKPQVADAANAAAERLERATERLFVWSMVALAILGLIVATLIVMHHVLDVKKHRKRREIDIATGVFRKSAPADDFEP
jgi:hypothetical protein